MKHYIIAKLKEGFKAEDIAGPVKNLFEGLLTLDGIHGVEVKTNCVDRANRYNIMIIIDMEPEALERYDVSEPHKAWKARYGEMLESKAIFDSAD